MIGSRARVYYPRHNLFGRLWSVHRPRLRDDVELPARHVPLLRELRDWRILGDGIASLGPYENFERLEGLP